MLKYTEVGLSHREVPNETSLCIYLSGCMHKCVNCHYPELQRVDYGDLLSLYFNDIVDLYLRQCTCVCFLGEGRCGVFEKEEFSRYVTYANSKGLKTCLYCGRDTNIEPWMRTFDYIKTGSYQTELGPLDSPTTNQRMYKKETDAFIDITHLFWE